MSRYVHWRGNKSSINQRGLDIYYNDEVIMGSRIISMLQLLVLFGFFFLKQLLSLYIWLDTIAGDMLNGTLNCYLKATDIASYKKNPYEDSASSTTLLLMILE